MAAGLFERWLAKREGYRGLFWNNDASMKNLVPVMNDLRSFCRADQSCVVVGKDGRIDTHATAVAEGRREVWLRIVETLNLSDEALTKIKELEQ